MNYYEGLPFFLLLIPILGIAVILGVLEKPLRLYGLIASLAVAACVFLSKGGLSGRDSLFQIWNAYSEALYFPGFILWSMGLLFFYLHLRAARGRNGPLFHVFCLLALLPLAACKISAVFHLGIFAFTGISYLTFRVLQIIIEAYDGVIKELDPLETTAFLLFFPSLSSGPIDRSRRFHTDWERRLSRADYLELAAKGIWQLLLGAVYKMVLAAGAYKLVGYLDTGESWYHYLAYAYAYGLYLFFDFAGYSLMATGSGRLLGVELPDNFRMPFLSCDIREFWDRWHISLSHWFRDFIFTRFIMTGTRKKWFGSRLNRACAGFFVNMGIMGIWHGITPAYILYGLYHGALLAATEVYQKKSGFHKKHKDKTAYRLASWFITMQLVMFGFLIFSGKRI